MLKILYAASNNSSAKIQLARFMKAMEGKPYIVKVAAYKKSSPPINIDWTLDCLLNIYKPNHISLENDNFSIYYEQVKYFSPDLIISDLEYFTSYIANVLDISLWQCSSAMINFALSHEEKYNLGIFKHYSYVLNKNPLHSQRMINIIDGSNENFVYSHLGDTVNPPILNDKFGWIRPYHTIGKISIPCRHNIVGATLDNNKHLISLVKNHKDSVIFSTFPYEEYSGLQVKDIENEAEYSCNLSNSNLFVCEGQTSFLADAFYNNKYSAILTNVREAECIINSSFSKRFEIGESIYEDSADLEHMMSKRFDSSFNEDIKFLHERIEEL